VGSGSSATREGRSGAPGAPGAPERRRAIGYASVGGASLIMGSIGVMVRYATAPASMLLVMRMAIGGVVVGYLFARAGAHADLRQPGVPKRLVLVGVVAAGNLLCYFTAIRYTDVAVAIFTSYMAPVYVALVSPLVLKQPTEKAVYGALGLSLTGMGVILVPGLIARGAHLSAFGVAAGIVAGVLYAAFLIIAKGLRTHVSQYTVVLAECVATTALLLPLGLYQTIATGYHITLRDLTMAVLLGVLNTALSFSLFQHGLRFIRVQHASILGYLEPVSAPLYAFIFLSEKPALWTIAGGALIIAAGVLVVALGRAEEEPLP